MKVKSNHSRQNLTYDINSPSLEQSGSIYNNEEQKSIPPPIQKMTYSKKIINNNKRNY